jgi:hypothetical protein
MFNYETIGNIHIHSILSDGTAAYDEIAEKALAAGLDFICLNDHDYMAKTLDLEEEGFFARMPLLIGLEIGRRYNHYLAFNLRSMINTDGLSPQEVIDEVRKQGGIGFIAHPFEKGMPFRERSKAYTWNDLSVKGYTGICIWNFSSRWKERVKSIFHAMFLMKFRSQMLQGPSTETMSFYDELCRHRRVVAVGGSDAHGAFFKWWRFNIQPLPYESLFRSINIHLFLKKKIFRDFLAAKDDIYEAMREGRLFIANDDICPARGFRFNYISEDGSDLNMGEEGAFYPGNLIIEAPAKGEIRLIKDGRLLKRVRGTEAVIPVTEKGVYRVEVFHRLVPFGWRPWIFTNPIYLR